MKAKYLDALRAKLEEFQASKADINDIINDYSQLYDDAIDRGKTDEEVYQTLGDPKRVAYDLIDTLKLKKSKNVKTKIVALMPFISIITFMGIGLYTDIWHPTWLVFFLIPMVAIILNTKTKEMLVAISPFVATIIFILLGTYKDLWNPGWLIFLIIPMLGILQSDKKKYVILQISSFIIAIGIYLFVGYTYGEWTLGALGFVLPLIVGIATGEMKFVWDMPEGKPKKKVILLLSVIFSSLIMFLLLGLLLDGWAYAWQVFLFIPIVSIIAFDKFRLTPLMPFIAVMIFFNLGFFFGLWTISWIAFLLIPITAIIENA